MVRHIVSWNFKPELTPQQRQTNLMNMIRVALEVARQQA